MPDSLGEQPVVPNNPHVRRFLDLSTAHLDQTAREWLGDGTDGNTAPTDYGWWVTVPSQAAQEGSSYPKALLACFEAARAHGCRYILFDAECAEMDGLATYEDGEVADEAEAVLFGEADAEEAQAEAERRLDALETAYLDGEIARSQWANGGA